MKTYNSWRPSYVRNQSNFANRIAHYRKLWRGATTANQRKTVAANFNKEYNAWLKKVHSENVRRRREEAAFFNKIRKAKRQGPEAEEQVLAEYGVVPNKPSERVSRTAPTPRSGRKRNTFNLRKFMAARNLAQRRENLMTQKRNLEAKRNNLERQINAVINKIRELPA